MINFKGMQKKSSMQRFQTGLTFNRRKTYPQAKAKIRQTAKLMGAKSFW